MIQVLRNLHEYHELLIVLAWKSIAVRYKQAYLGVAWAILKPLVLVLIFMLVRSFVGIDSGDVPYPLLTYCALLPWMFFQESSSDGVVSVVNHANLVRKIYFPREILPLSAVLTKIVELSVNFLILALFMAWFGYGPKATLVWVPVLLLVTAVAALTLSFAGAAFNVHVRDVTHALPLALSLMMYASPVIYPLSLVKKKLLIEQAAGDWSNTFYTIYALNPMAGVIDSFQRVVLEGLPPDWATLGPGLIFLVVCLPFSFAVFRRAEAYFADVV